MPHSLPISPEHMPGAPHDAVQPSPAVAKAVLLAILVSSAFQIFFRLAEPGLWLDEAAALMHARYPLAYLIALSRGLEEHPPLFYMATKLFMLLGRDDFFVRLLPALCGVGCTAMIYAVGRRLLSTSGGLIAAALWTVSPHILWLSRMARPYIVFSLLVLVSFYLLLGCLQAGSPRRMVPLLLINALILLVHYMGAFVICSEIVSLVLCRLVQRRKVLDAGMALLMGVSAVYSGAVYAFFISGSKNPTALLAERLPLDTVLASTALNNLDNLTFFTHPVLGAVLLAAAFASMFQLLRWRRCAGILLLGNTLGPIVLLVVLQKADGLYPRHYSFILIFLSLGLASGVTRLLSTSHKTILLALALLVMAFTGNMVLWRQAYYEENSYQIPIIGDNYKALAKELARHLDPSEVLNFSNVYFGNVVSFSLDRMVGVDIVAPDDAFPATGRPDAAGGKRGIPLASRMHLGLEDKQVRLAMLMNMHTGYLAKSPADFARRWGPMDEVVRIDRSTLLRQTVVRSPVHALHPFPEMFQAPMEYVPFYQNVSEALDIAFSQDARGPAIVPSRNEQETVVGYVLENQVDARAQVLRVLVEFDNTGQDNQLWLEYAFDQDAPRRLLVSKGYDVAHQALAVLRRDTPFRRLTLRVVMVCATKEPSEDGTNLHTLRFKGLECLACPAEGETACTEAADAQLGLSRLGNYLSEDFLGTSTIQQTTAPENVNIVIHPEGNDHTWAPYVPADVRVPAILRMRVRLSKDRLTFFPRLGKDSWLRVELLTGTGEMHQLFYMENATDAWTPIGGRYELSVSKDMLDTEQELCITFGGRWAQLWQLHNIVFF